MSNDLISRNALLNHLRGNVLVDVTPNASNGGKQIEPFYPEGGKS